MAYLFRARFILSLFRGCKTGLDPLIPNFTQVWGLVIPTGPGALTLNPWVLFVHFFAVIWKAARSL